MKKKSIVVIVLLFFVVIAYLYFKYIYGWLEFRKNTDTPKEFLSNIKISRSDYIQDSIKVNQQLQDLLNNHKQSFYIKDYFYSTELIIDSILYSPDFNKMVVFVITKNPTYRQSMPNEKYKWYYDGYCYFGTRHGDTVDLNWLGYGFTNSYDESDISSTLRSYYFREFASVKDTSGLSKYKYNLNDIRFWECSIWKEIEEKKIKKQEFEDEKKRHPENVYEPKQ